MHDGPGGIRFLLGLTALFALVAIGSAGLLARARRQDIRIAVLGLGPIGQSVATGLAMLGFSVAGWSRTARDIASVETFTGDPELEAAVSGADLLVNLLPLRPETENILSERLFSRLAPGAYLANLGRGGHLDEGHLRRSLADGRIAAAWLDAFRVEPLPAEHWFWGDPRIHVTPHTGGLPTASGAAQSLVAVIDALNKGLPLPGLVRAGVADNSAPKPNNSP
eukprot:gene11842-15807_t